MAVVRTTRFTIDPARTQEMLAARAALVAGVRARFPGLTEARLARLDDETWIDMWRWESEAHTQAALDGASTIPEAPAAFALTRDLTSETATLVDER